MVGIEPGDFCVASNRFATNHALVSLFSGNLQQYVPFVLKEIENQPKRQYLLLHSLKEIISWQSTSTSGVAQLQQFVPAIWAQLFLHCECQEEGWFSDFFFF